MEKEFKSLSDLIGRGLPKDNEMKLRDRYIDCASIKKSIENLKEEISFRILEDNDLIFEIIDKHMGDKLKSKKTT